MSEKWSVIRSAIEELERGGWTITPPPPKPVLPVVSEEAVRAYDSAGFKVRDGLRAAFKVMLRENLIRYWRKSEAMVCKDVTGVYRALTGEEWPK